MYLKFKIKKGYFIVLGVVIILLLTLPMIAGFTRVSDDSVVLPIIMYHGILKDAKMQGEYVISPADFENDLKFITENNYTAITVNDLTNYVYENINLPEKPIMITFDDGYLNNYVYAFPLIKKYGCKMVLSPIGKYADEYSISGDNSVSYANATWNELKEMQDSGFVEIQNHTYDLHNSSGTRLGAKQKSGESDSNYKEIISTDIKKAQDLIFTNLGITPSAFIYPFGAISKSSDNIMKDIGFKCTMICEKRVNYITHDKECLYSLGRFIRSNKISAREILSKQ